MKGPTFELLRVKRELAVVNPANGVRFRVSLRDWQGVLWAVRVQPHDHREPWNPFTTSHRLMPQERIQGWLETLQFVQPVRCSRRVALAT